MFKATLIALACWAPDGRRVEYDVDKVERVRIAEYYTTIYRKDGTTIVTHLPCTKVSQE